MEISRTNGPSFITLRLSGDLDANSSAFLDAEISSLLASGSYNLHVSLADVAYISSAGLGVFISYLEDIKSHGGSLVLSGLQPGVLHVFQLLGLDKLVSIVSTEEAASQMFSIQ